MPHPGDCHLVHVDQGLGIRISEILTSDSQCIPGREAVTGLPRLVSLLYLGLYRLDSIIMALLWIFIFVRSSYNSWNISRYLLLLLCFYIGGSQTFTWGMWEKIQGSKPPLKGPGFCFIHLCSWWLQNTPQSENHYSTIYMVLLVIVEFRNYLIGLLVRSALSFQCRLQGSP